MRRLSKCGHCRMPVRIDVWRLGTYHCDQCSLVYRTVVDGTDVPDAHDDEGFLRKDLGEAE